MELKNNEEILKMFKEKIIKYKDNALLELARNDGCSDCSDCSYCSDCSRCSRCSGCSYCSDCYACVNIKDKQYMICNVQFTKDEYKKKIKDIEG